MARTAHKSEQYPTALFSKDLIKNTALQHIASAAVRLVEDLELKGMVVFTQSGRSAKIVSSCKPVDIKIYAFTDSPETQAGLILCRSVYPFLIEFLSDFEKTAQIAIKTLRETKEFQPGDQVVVIHEIIINGRTIPSIQVRNVFD
jgi:pyruvate kinase